MANLQSRCYKQLILFCALPLSKRQKNLINNPSRRQDTFYRRKTVLCNNKNYVKNLQLIKPPPEARGQFATNSERIFLMNFINLLLTIYSSFFPLPKKTPRESSHNRYIYINNHVYIENEAICMYTDHQIQHVQMNIH